MAGTLRTRIYENNTEAAISIQTEVEGYLKKKRQSLYPKQVKSGNVVNGGGGNDNDVGCGLLVYNAV